MCELKAYENPHRNTIDLYVRDENLHGKFIVMEQIPDGEPISPFLTLTPENAQLLMNDLWRIGLRPRNQQYTQETIQALSAHLQDFRRLTFDLFSYVTQKKEKENDN